MDELILLTPTMEYAGQIMAYRQEFLEAGSSMDGCGPLRRCETAEEFLRIVDSYTHPETLPERMVIASQFLCVRKSDDRLIGMIQVRHYFNEYLEKYAGHIGYSVRPTERRKGYAKDMLRITLPFCRSIGLRKVLICCIDGNTGSEKTILANGGVYESTVYEPNGGEYLKRFWIDLSQV